MNLKEQKRYHKRKLAIIKMIEHCDRYIHSEKKNMVRNNSYGLGKGNSLENIARYEIIKKYLLNRYKN